MLAQIDRYEIASEIGHGGMATVYRARDTRLDRWVAVKVMHPHLRGTEQARARFAREAKAVARLKHPAILEIYDYSGHDSENAYIVTELLTGPTLRAFVEQTGEIPPEIAACIGVSLASALSAAHAQGIVHRDVKPENVLLHERQLLKLTDFGIADMVDPTMSAMTATGQILGSPAHMAPEQVEGGETDARTDVFALGTILYWLATGIQPFVGKNPHQVLKRVVEAQPVDPLLVRPSIGRSLRDIILRCLEKEPAARFQTAADVEAALLAFLADVGMDEPRVVLAAYLHDPAGESRRLRTFVIARLLDGARRALAVRDRPRVMERLDRILAIDEREPHALELLDQVDRATRVRATARVAFALAAAEACIGLWMMFAPTASDPVRGRVSGIAPSATPAADTKPLSMDPTNDAPIAGHVDPEHPQTGSAQIRKPAPRAAKPRPTATGVPRTVVLSPEPANVTISVDGADGRAFGPSFRTLELPPGLHTFRFVGARSCCEDAVVEVDLPDGPGETVVQARLRFRDARVYVASNVPADVSVDGVAVGRARSLLSVARPRALVERRQISVTAPGFAPYTGIVELRAGEVTELDVDLEPSAPH